MSKVRYIKNTACQYVMHCSWTESGKLNTYDFTGSGDVFDVINDCYKSIIWSSLDSFKIDRITKTIY